MCWTGIRNCSAIIYTNTSPVFCCPPVIQTYRWDPSLPPSTSSELVPNWASNQASLLLFLSFSLVWLSGSPLTHHRPQRYTEKKDTGKAQHSQTIRYSKNICFKFKLFYFVSVLGSWCVHALLHEDWSLWVPWVHFAIESLRFLVFRSREREKMR